jgi:hypothetical protein
MCERDPLSSVPISLGVVRDARASDLPVGTFATGGLRAVATGSLLARDAGRRELGQARPPFFIAFYGRNGARTQFLDDARGAGIREVPDAFRASFFAGRPLPIAFLLAWRAFSIR